MEEGVWRPPCRACALMETRLRPPPSTAGQLPFSRLATNLHFNPQILSVFHSRVSVSPSLGSTTQAILALFAPTHSRCQHSRTRALRSGPRHRARCRPGRVRAGPFSNTLSLRVRQSSTTRGLARHLFTRFTHSRESRVIIPSEVIAVLGPCVIVFSRISYIPILRGTRCLGVPPDDAVDDVCSILSLLQRTG